MNSSEFQDSQMPDNFTQDPRSSSTQRSLHKYHPEWKSIENKRKNKRSHDDWIEQMNITDPDSTPSDTPDEDWTI